MKPATEGQFHQVIAHLLTNTPYGEIKHQGIQNLISEPGRLVELFCRFLSSAGDNVSLPMREWKMLIPEPGDFHAPSYNLDRKKFRVDKNAWDMLVIMSKFCPTKKNRRTYLAKVKPSHLLDTELTLKEFFDVAERSNLKLCGDQTLLNLRTRYLDQPEGETLYMAMENNVMEINKLTFVLANKPHDNHPSLCLLGVAPPLKGEIVDPESNWVFEIVVD